MAKTHQAENELTRFESARLQVLQAQRKKLIEMWKEGEIDDNHFTHFENELDIIDVHIARGELQ